jgi:hypothetical protein
VNRGVREPRPHCIYFHSGPGSSVGIATGYGLNGPGIESQLGGPYFPHLPRPALGLHPASCTMDTGSFPGVESRRGVTLTPPLLAPRSKQKSRNTPLHSWPVKRVKPTYCQDGRTNVPQFYAIRILPILLTVTAVKVKGNVRVHAAKAHRGSGGIDPLLFNLCTSWRRAVSLKPQPHYSRRNTTRCTLNRILGGFHIRVRELKRETLPLLKPKPRSPLLTDHIAQEVTVLCVIKLAGNGILTHALLLCY